MRRNTTFSQADKTGLDGPSYPMLDKFSRDTCGFYLSVPLGKEGDVRIKPDFTGHNRLLAHTTQREDLLLQLGHANRRLRVPVP